MMAGLRFIGLFTLCGNWNQQGGGVPLMWPTALCSGLAALPCAGQSFEEILQHLSGKCTVKADVLGL